MKRYLLFGGDDRYTDNVYGGWQDFLGDFDSIADAKAFVGQVENRERANEDARLPRYAEYNEYHYLQWWHIVDTDDMKLVCGYFGAAACIDFPEYWERDESNSGYSTGHAASIYGKISFVREAGESSTFADGAQDLLEERGNEQAVDSALDISPDI